MADNDKKTRKSVAPIYGAAVTWAVYAAVFSLYRPSQFVFAALLSGGVFLLLQAVCPEEEISVPEPPAEKKEEPSTGNPELDKVIRDGQMAISEMRRLDASIADEKISADIRRLEAVSNSIFQQVKEDPAKLPQLRRFMDYYLPTTLKLLNAYDRMDAAGVSGQNINSTKRRVEEMMTTIVAAFEKQLDGLFGSDALDISTDISVLESMLIQEGLAGEKLEAETAGDGGGTNINLNL